MNARDVHSAAVTAWLAHGADRDAPSLLRGLESALRALWSRAQPTLGEVTLVAILDRVFYDTGDRFPGLQKLAAGFGGIEFESLRRGTDSLTVAQLVPWIRFVLEEFLTVLGNLTAEILSPALHAALDADDIFTVLSDRPAARGPQGNQS